MDPAKGKSSRRPLIIVSIIFVVVVVIVGVVVWKVTKDAYESDNDHSSNQTSEDVSDSTQDPATTTGAPLTEEELRKHPYKGLRLPRNVLPVHYDITLFPDFYDNGTMFYGNETIELLITSPTRYVLIHVHTDFMTITDTHVKDNETDTEIPIERTFYYEENEFYVIETKNEMEKAIRVDLMFEGFLNKSIMGLYKSTYLDTQSGEKKYLSASKFEPTYARRAFPCLDEPNIKAQYTVTIIHRDGYIALSNMPVQEEKTDVYVGGSKAMKSTKFQRSVKMSTYLVCFIVCDFEFKETRSTGGVPVRVYATPDKINQTDYALEVAKHSLDKYEEVFKIEYPLPKQDLIGIPDFVSGAMEHWGLITFRESLFLYNHTKAPLSSKERVASVVCHEMAHQWFGNIVTMDWWDDLWLNEGFASYMEYMCVASKEKSWSYTDQILLFDTLKVMPSDSQISTHPIVVNVKNPDEITSVFDAISYSKGAAVINMMETIMGNDNFFQGISNYLKAFAYGNAKTDDLWDYLSKVDSRIKVKDIMDTWTRQDGFPYVNISLTALSNGMTKVSASQSRFLSDPDAVYTTDASPFRYKWYIDLDYVTSKGKNGSKIMDKASEIHFEDDFGLSESKTNWLKFNRNKNGFYRVLYPEDMWNRFANYLTETPSDSWTMATRDRTDLLSDAFSFAESGLISYEIPLTLASYLSNETQYVPWSVAVNYGIFYITDMLLNTADFTLWKLDLESLFQEIKKAWKALCSVGMRYLVEQVKPTVERLKFEDKGSQIERKLRSLVMNQACKYQEESTSKEVERMFRDWLDNGTSLSINIRAAVYACGMAYFGTDKDWNEVWGKYQIESSPQEKELLIYALSKTKKPYLISQLLDKAKREDGIKTQDFFTVVGNVGANVYGNHIAWDWARQNYKDFETRFTVNDRSFGRMVYGLVKKYNTDFQLNEVKNFFKNHPNEGASARYRKMAIESIEKNINWMKKAKEDIVMWLNNRYTPSR